MISGVELTRAKPNIKLRNITKANAPFFIGGYRFLGLNIYPVFFKQSTAITFVVELPTNNGTSLQVDACCIT